MPPTLFASAPNPAVPEPFCLPRAMPGLSRTDRSGALKGAFALRVRAFACACVILFLPLLFHIPGPISSGSTLQLTLLAVSSALFFRLISLKDHHPSLHRWGHTACLLLSTLIILSLFPVDESRSEALRQNLLLGIVLSGALFLLTSWFALSAGISAAFYAFIVFQTPGARDAFDPWLDLLSVGVLSAVIHAAQRALVDHYNTITLTDEARFQLYVKAAEEAREAARRYRRLSDASKEAILLHTDGTVVDANRSALDLFGAEPGNLIGGPIASLLAKGSSRLAGEITDPSNPTLSRVKVVRKDGTLVETLGYHHLVMFPDGSYGVLGFRTIEPPSRGEARPVLGAPAPHLN